MSFTRCRRVLSLLAAVACTIALSLPALGKDHKVSIKDVSFAPKEIKIKKGDTVIWTNADERDHTVTADDESFQSGNLGNGETFKQRFAKAGKFKYHCEYHPRMKATVVVEN